jgi:hypothetical protein
MNPISSGPPTQTKLRKEPHRLLQTQQLLRRASTASCARCDLTRVPRYSTRCTSTSA